MKLVDLIEYLKDQDKLEQLFIDENLNLESDAIIICMERLLDIQSNIKLFEVEETGGDLNFDIGGVSYVELLPAYHAMEIVKSYFNKPEEKAYGNLELAKRLLEYRIKDA